MTKFIRSLACIGLCVFCLSSFAGCEAEINEGPVEDAAEEVDEAAEEMGEAVDG